VRQIIIRDVALLRRRLGHPGVEPIDPLIPQNRWVGQIVAESGDVGIELGDEAALDFGVVQRDIQQLLFGRRAADGDAQDLLDAELQEGLEPLVAADDPPLSPPAR
jgi:hypothetical protein